MITYAQFIASYPEFRTTEQMVVENAIAQVQIESDNYDGLGKPELQQQAIALHVAHNLKLGKWSEEDKPGPVKSLRSNNDQIEFAVSPELGFSLGSTQYGMRLQALLRRANTIFAVC